METKSPQSARRRTLARTSQPETASRTSSFALPAENKAAHLASGFAGTQRAAGNLAFQRMLSGGTIQVELARNQPGSPSEQEADYMAHQALHQSTGLPGSEQISPQQNARAVPSSPRLLLEESLPLKPAERAYFEARFHHDFAGVRIYNNHAAVEMAKALNSRAFTIGENIVFGANEYLPGTVSGQALLAHELAHVVQQSRGEPPVLQRQVANPAREQHNSSVPIDAAAAPGAPHASGDFEQPDPVRLTNEQLLSQLVSNEQWLTAHYMVEAEYSSRTSYLRLLQSERDRRIRNGHVWLSDTEGTSGVPLYMLLPQEDGVLVVEAYGDDQSAGNSLGPGRAIFTRQQLDRVLQAQGIPTVTPANAAQAGMMGSGAYIPPEYGGYQSRFSRGYNVDTIDTIFVGDTSEYFFNARTSGQGGRINLNTRPWQNWRRTNAGWRAIRPQTGSHPIWDFLEGSGELISNKSSTDGPGARFDYYTEGYRDLIGGSNFSNARKFDMAMWNLDNTQPAPRENQASLTAMTPVDRQTRTLARQRFIQRGRLAVNADDVVAYRNNLEGRMMQNPLLYAEGIDAFLTMQPEVAGGTTYTTTQQILAAPAADRSAVLGRVLRRIVNTQIISSEVRTQAILNFQASRRLYGLDPNGVTANRPDIAARAWPEYMAARESGYLGASLRPMRSGVPMGGVIAVVADGIITYYRTGHLPSGSQAGISLVSGMVGGAVGTGSETVINAAVAQRLAAAGAPGWIAGRAGTGLARGIGGFGAGGLAASAFTLSSMGLRDLTDPNYNPTGIDYFASGGRAFVVGGLSGMMTAGLTGAMFGTALGPLGWIVGFVIGIAAYALVDYLIGDSVERGLRSIAG